MLGKYKIIQIAAISKTRLLANSKGKTAKEQIPWKISSDLKYFKAITEHHVVVMGRKTFDSIGQKPLPNRINIVVSKSLNAIDDDLVIVLTEISKLPELLEKLEKQKTSKAVYTDIDFTEIFIIGGAQIYNLTLDFTDKLYLTVVEGDFAGDVYFPEFTNKFTQISSKQEEENNYKFAFKEFVRNL